MAEEFKFRFDPAEPPAEHEIRWDKEVTELASRGLTIQGLGPDGDWPIRLEDETGKELVVGAFLAGPMSYVEVYGVAPIAMLDGQAR